MMLVILHHTNVLFFFFNDTATTEIYTLSLHDALPIYLPFAEMPAHPDLVATGETPERIHRAVLIRSEEHTSELQSQSNLVCRLLLEKKKIHYPTCSIILYDWTDCLTSTSASTTEPVPC